MLRDYRVSLFGAFALLAGFIAAGCHNTTTPPPVVAPPSFVVTPLAANKANASSYGTVAAANIDTDLQDTWGIGFDTASGYAWVANRGTGTTSILDNTGKPGTSHWNIDGPGGAQGTPTGIVENLTSNFQVPGTGVAADWIYSELNGTLAAVATHASGDSSFLVNSQYAGSSAYTGLALVTDASGTHSLYATDVKQGSLTQYNTSFVRGNQSSGQHSGYTPFNVVVSDTQMFVAEAKMYVGGSPPYVWVGPGYGGYIDVYSLNGMYEKTLISNDSLDEPWGIAIAPSSFGTYSGDLLVGNFGDGKIHAYDRKTGAFMGTLNDASGAPIVINGLWALVVYGNTLYYTAGPTTNGTTFDGVFGTITVK